MEGQNKCKGVGRNQPVYTTYHKIQDTLYIIEHEASPDAKETVSEKIQRLVLRDVERSFRRKLWGFIVPLDIFIDILSAICKYMVAWGLSGRRKYEKTISKKRK